MAHGGIFKTNSFKTKQVITRLATTIVWRNFSILSPKLVLAYAEDIFSESRLKNCAMQIWMMQVCRCFGLKKDFLVKKCI